MFGNFRMADIIAYYFSRIDTLCRKELNNGILVSERDYVTALSTRIRDDIHIRELISCHSQTVRSRTETENGVDGIIVFKLGNKVKAGLFEAKRPQIFDINNPKVIKNYCWDVLTDRRTSHFSEQIQKQHKWVGALALWEMFFNDGPSGFACPPFDAHGSSCTWHDNTYNFMNTQGLIFSPWKTNDLQVLLKNDFVSFYSIIYDIISCKVGKQFNINLKKQTATIHSPINKNIFMEIPLPIDTDKDHDDRVEVFLEENGLDIFTFINLDQADKYYEE